MASVNSNAIPLGSKPIETLPSTSSFIAAFEYDETNMRLTTHMRDGSIYQHVFVLPSEWEALKVSQNHSKHWANQISGKKQDIKVKSAKKPKSSIRHYKSPGR